MTIKLISSPPEVLTREQATQLHQNTLDSKGVLPIIHHTQDNVRVVITPPATDTTFGRGTLWVTESNLFFYSRETNVGLAIDYPTIIIHAISRQEVLDGTGSCIYIQLGEKLCDLTNIGQEESQEEEENEEETPELKFIPDDIGSLDAVFEALSECAAMHPDKEFMEQEDEYHENGDENEWYTAAPSDEQELSEIGAASMAYLNSIIDQPVPTEQQELQNEYDQEMFEDADEE